MIHSDLLEKTNQSRYEPGPNVDAVFLNFGGFFGIEVVTANLYESCSPLSVAEDAIENLFDCGRGGGQAGCVLDR